MVFHTSVMATVKGLQTTRKKSSKERYLKDRLTRDQTKFGRWYGKRVVKFLYINEQENVTLTKKIHFYFFVVANLNNAVMKDNSMRSKMVEVNFIAWQITYGSFSEQNSPGNLLHRGQHSHWPNTFTLPPPQYKYFWHCKREIKLIKKERLN